MTTIRWVDGNGDAQSVEVHPNAVPLVAGKTMRERMAEMRDWTSGR